MEGKDQVKRSRTREGCWTCRRRKKKCDGGGIPCQNCLRLGIECETDVRLVWEDDTRRAGMKRRGPPSLKKSKVKPDGLHDSADRQDSDVAVERGSTTDSSSSSTSEANSSQLIHRNALQRIRAARLSAQSGISGFQRTLEATEVSLLDHYIQRFSREYPTCSGPLNPFLSVLLPLAMRSDVVLSSLLALSGAQRWGQHSSAFRRESLRLRHDALRGCRALLEQNDMLRHGRELTAPNRSRQVTSQSTDLANRQLSHAEAEKLVFVLTSSVLFLLWEKISGESTWKAHLEFISQFFNGFLPYMQSYLSSSVEGADAVRFCHDIFVYNDLVWATSTGSSLLSNFYLADVEGNPNTSGASPHPLSELMRSHAGGSRSLYYFPSLIARLSAGDSTVTVEEINLWDGNVQWLPSYSLYTGHGDPQRQTGENTTTETPASDRQILSELYRTACLIYRLQSLRKTENSYTSDQSSIKDHAQSLGQLTQQAYGLMRALPSGSSFENAMLWPMGIFGRELTLSQSYERGAVLSRLHDLENRFHMRHFGRARDFLMRQWSLRDSGAVVESEGSSSDVDSVLMG